jgi:hypothetical protein
VSAPEPSQNGGKPRAMLELSGPQREAEGRMGAGPSQETIYPDAPAPSAMPPDTGRKRDRSKGRNP